MDEGRCELTGCIVMIWICISILLTSVFAYLPRSYCFDGAFFRGVFGIAELP